MCPSKTPIFSIVDWSTKEGSHHLYTRDIYKIRYPFTLYRTVDKIWCPKLLYRWCLQKQTPIFSTHSSLQKNVSNISIYGIYTKESTHLLSKRKIYRRRHPSSPYPGCLQKEAPISSIHWLSTKEGSHLLYTRDIYICISRINSKKGTHVSIQLMSANQAPNNFIHGISTKEDAHLLYILDVYKRKLPTSLYMECLQKKAPIISTHKVFTKEWTHNFCMWYGYKRKRHLSPYRETINEGIDVLS